MPMTPGLSPSIRELPPEELEGLSVVEMLEDAEDKPEANDNGDVLRIEHGDGSVTVSIDGSPLSSAEAETGAPEKWFDNLADKIDAGELSRIAEDLLLGIDADLESRKEWVEARATGIKLLGLTIDAPGLGGEVDGAPVEGMSKVRHPLLLEAVLRFQANARSELLPTDGPVKIRNDNNDPSLSEDQLANALARDLNHYLTSTATEYYPDTDRMLLRLGFGGTAFKKVYFCPLRNRPVSETVDADDLIVDNTTTDLSNAKRITHRVMMKPSTVKRMQILEVYSDIDLSDPKERTLDAAQRAASEQQGIAQEAFRPQDRDREIYECYCELDIVNYRHKIKGKDTGLEIPYVVTIDVSSRQILSIVRNYDKPSDEDPLPVARQRFVKYTFVPGFGFYDIGLLHILGNTTNAITAAWREMLDAGMFANFPGFLMADSGMRQNTNIFRVPPGGGAPVKTNGMPINQAIMPLPYKEPGPAFIQLVQNMAETGQRVGGTAEVAVGEGRNDAPVGTTLALIDQATKVLNSVHKRMHAAQAEEFRLLVDCFKEHPQSFWQRNKRPAMQWDEDRFRQALRDCELVPQADPNTASQTQRMAKVMGLKELQKGNPTLYDPIAIDVAALQAMGWGNPKQFMVPPSAMGKPTPEMEEKIAKAKTEKQKADAQTMVAEATVAEKMAKVAGLGGEQVNPAELEIRNRELEIQNKEIDARSQDSQLDAINRLRDRESRERVAAVSLAKDLAKNPAGIAIVDSLLSPDMIHRLEANEQPLQEG